MTSAALSTDFTVAPCLSQRTGIVGTASGTSVTSMQYVALPVAMSRALMRGRGCPMSLYSSGFLRRGASVGVTVAAAAVSAPYDSLRPSGAMTYPFCVRRVPAGSFHCSAAADVMRALIWAPMTRTGSHSERVECEPPVSCASARLGSAFERATSMFSSGTSRLSAIIVAMVVMTPWPMSIRGISKYTRLSGLISTSRS